VFDGGVLHEGAEGSFDVGRVVALRRVKERKMSVTYRDEEGKSMLTNKCVSVSLITGTLIPR
jgi:hypothetical protein